VDAEIRIRPALGEDHQTLRQLILDAYQEFREALPGLPWDAYVRELQDVSARGAIGLLLVAQLAEVVVGTVTYLGPGAHRSPIAPAGFALIRVLAVPPHWRHRGVGRRLTQACIAKALEERCPGIALQTSSVMVTARRLYADLGFKFEGASMHPMGVELENYLLAFSRD
jgi:GNAT superfamily N-acetyltransferase